MGALMAWRQYHENSLTDHYEIAAVTIGSNNDCGNVSNLFHHHNKIGSMAYMPLFRVRSWNNGMHYMSFYILRFDNIPHTNQL